ncbi:MAG TPA: hypothetical protein VIZ66_01670 [Sphingomicrobium sp.]
MLTSTVLDVIPLILGLFAWQPGDSSVTRLVVQDEVILRVPVQPRPFGPHVEWREKKGPKCIPAGLIRRASLSGSEQVDLILSGGSRVRAQFEDDCPALDFYGGFYLQYGRDQQICAKRDAVQSRMGRNCTIERFRLLIPKFKH